MRQSMPLAHAKTHKDSSVLFCFCYFLLVFVKLFLMYFACLCAVFKMQAEFSGIIALAGLFTGLYNVFVVHCG